MVESGMLWPSEEGWWETVARDSSAEEGWWETVAWDGSAEEGWYVGDSRLGRLG